MFEPFRPATAPTCLPWWTTRTTGWGLSHRHCDGREPIKTAYVETIAVGDPLPEMPLFLYGEYGVEVALEETDQTTWGDAGGVAGGGGA